MSKYLDIWFSETERAKVDMLMRSLVQGTNEYKVIVLYGTNSSGKSSFCNLLSEFQRNRVPSHIVTRYYNDADFSKIIVKNGVIEGFYVFEVYYSKLKPDDYDNYSALLIKFDQFEFQYSNTIMNDINTNIKNYINELTAMYS